MKTRSPWQSVACACRGVWQAARTSRNLRIHVVVGAVVIVAAAFLVRSPLEWAVLALAIGLVIAAELMNTAIEAVVDLVSPEHHGLAKLAKDVAAGAVLIAALAAVVVGAVILGPRLLEWFNG